MHIRLLTVSVALACGGFVGCKMKQTHGSRDSGQSRLMDDTFAGQNACNPENHDRPFIIEWDATDMSSFESLAASDIVFVKYEGCSLKVLDECKNDSIRGEQGAYKPPEWTSGSLETIDIHNEGELYAKLPLGSASLGGRVSGGEQFHMEYFVAGTRYASRDAVYAKDLDGRYGCESATHFVYGYNLGAFALGSANEISAEAGGSVYGFGAGGKTSQGSKAEKKGGNLADCHSDSMTEIAGCKAPIRLQLRKIRPGESPEAEAMAAPETPESVSAAAVLNSKMEMSEEAQGYLKAATEKWTARDGKGCLAELDKHDRVNPKGKSTDPKNGAALTRAMCVMLSGKCDAGKVQYRKALEKANATGQPDDALDRTVDAMASLWCQGNMKPADRVRKASIELQQATYQGKKPASFCTERIATIVKWGPKAKAREEHDQMVSDWQRNVFNMGVSCYERAGDCKAAWNHFNKHMNAELREGLDRNKDPEVRKKSYRQTFESFAKKCAGK